MIQPNSNLALRRIPSLDAFLRRASLAGLPRPLAQRESRRFLDSVRGRVLAGEIDEAAVVALFDGVGGENEVIQACVSAQRRHHARVLNATGIVLHTGIGRAPLAAAAQEAMFQAAGYAIVEVDPDTGLRNQRETRVSQLLQELLGVGAGLPVNNNAAATTLVLAALAAGRDVITSRGELVEIGGGFRVPDVMRQAGCDLVEVGATNRTHLRDFADAIGERTAMLMKVHTSNFRLVGFHSVPGLKELATLAAEHDVLSFEDLGSGLICEQEVSGLVHEPRVQDSLAAGMDLVCFSGDKLLGGPQCGMIVGDAELVARVRAHPLYRAMRCDKLTLAALEATLTIYRDGDPLEDIPALRALSRSAADLEGDAARLLAMLESALPAGARMRVVPSQSFAGSGANPAHPIPSAAVAIPGGDDVAEALRRGPGVPVIARIEADHVLLDLRSLCGEDLTQVAHEVGTKLHGLSL